MDKYADIAARFGYDVQRDRQAAALLNTLLTGPPSEDLLTSIISDRTVLCVGAGPSLAYHYDAIHSAGAVVIAADSATVSLLKYGIIPDIVVSDLDGPPGSLMEMAHRMVPFVVHAHGDNIQRLHMISHLPVCAGTAQTEPVGNVQNWGGFTDGDRAVFLASHFGARNIVLCGMDLDGPANTWSVSPDVKLRKMAVAAKLLEWLSSISASRMYTISSPLRGFEQIGADAIVSV